MALNNRRTEKALQKTSSLTQQWVEAMHNNQKSSTPNVYANQQALINRQKFLFRDSSVQSDDSHCSSVESVLELRKPDPEQVLLELGFGPRDSSSLISRIPSRFLQPSKLITHIDINQFMEQYRDGDETSNPPSISASPARLRTRSH